MIGQSVNHTSRLARAWRVWQYRNFIAVFNKTAVYMACCVRPTLLFSNVGHLALFSMVIGEGGAMWHERLPPPSSQSSQSSLLYKWGFRSALSSGIYESLFARSTKFLTICLTKNVTSTTACSIVPNSSATIFSNIACPNLTACCKGLPSWPIWMPVWIVLYILV